MFDVINSSIGLGGFEVLVDVVRSSPAEQPLAFSRRGTPMSLSRVAERGRGGLRPGTAELSIESTEIVVSSGIGHELRRGKPLKGCPVGVDLQHPPERLIWEG